MALFTCDICGQRYLPTSGKLEHFEELQYVHVQLLPPTKPGKTICKPCLQRAQRIKARYAELEQRWKIVTRPGAEAWLDGAPPAPPGIASIAGGVGYQAIALEDEIWQLLSRQEALEQSLCLEGMPFNSLIEALYGADEHGDTDFSKYIFPATANPGWPPYDCFRMRLVDEYQDAWANLAGSLYRHGNDAFVIRWQVGYRGRNYMD